MTDSANEVQVRREPFAFAGTGEIYSFTVLQEVPESFAAQGPYVVAMVRLDEGPIVTAQITDLDGELQIGDRVEMVTRKLATEGSRGMIVYGYKFRRILKRA